MPPTRDLTGPWLVLAGVRLLAEVCMLGVLAYVGWRIGPSTPARLVLAVTLPTLAALVWGTWVAPRAAHRLADPARLAVEIMLFGVAAVGVTAATRSVAGAVTAGILLAAYAVSTPVGRAGH